MGDILANVLLFQSILVALGEKNVVSMLTVCVESVKFEWCDSAAVSDRNENEGEGEGDCTSESMNEGKGECKSESMEELRSASESNDDGESEKSGYQIGGRVGARVKDVEAGTYISN